MSISLFENRKPDRKIEIEVTTELSLPALHSNASKVIESLNNKLDQFKLDNPEIHESNIYFKVVNFGNINIIKIYGRRKERDDEFQKRKDNYKNQENQKQQDELTIYLKLKEKYKDI